MAHRTDAAARLASGGARSTRYAARMAADGRGGVGLPGSPAEPIVDPSWLAARVAADTSARAATVDTLLPELINYLIESAAIDGDVLEIIDLGAGNGRKPALAGATPALSAALDPS